MFINNSNIIIFYTVEVGCRGEILCERKKRKIGEDIAEAFAVFINIKPDTYWGMGKYNPYLASAD